MKITLKIHGSGLRFTPEVKPHGWAVTCVACGLNPHVLYNGFVLTLVCPKCRRTITSEELGVKSKRAHVVRKMD